MAAITQIIKNNPILKKIFHWLIIPSGQARPRIWVSWFVNPFFHKRGKGCKISGRTRMDVFPFNPFELGAGSVIEDFTTVNNGVGSVIIGQQTLIGIGNVIIGPISIGNNVILAQNIVISGLNHQYIDVDLPIVKQPVTTKQIIIEDDCWIAANVVTTQGVTIGKHCVIAAGAVVTKNIPPYSVAAGNPAKIIKQYNFERQEWEKVRNL